MPPAADPTRLPTGAFAVLSFAAFGSAISLRVTDALLPRLGSDFHIGLGEAAGVITVFAMAYGLAQLFFGPVGDRFGKYRVIAWGCAACALTATLCGLAPSFGSLLAARLLAGATAASIIPLSMAFIGDVVPYDKRQPVLARFLIGQVLGISSGVLMGGYAADHLGWRMPFFGIGALFVVISAALFFIHARLPASARATHRAPGNALVRMVGEFRQVLAVRWARVVIATVFLEGVCLYGVFAFIASHLHQRFGISLSAAGSTVMLFGFGGLLFALAASRLVRRLGETGLTTWGAGLMAASLLSVGLTPVWWWAMPACFVCGLGFYMMHNTLQTNATQMAPERRGAAVSTFASCFFLGQAVGVGIAGQLVARVGTSVLLCAGALGVLLVGLNFSRLKAQALVAATA